jgi:hypothetical protein
MLPLVFMLWLLQAAETHIFKSADTILAQLSFRSLPTKSPNNYDNYC